MRLEYKYGQTYFTDLHQGDMIPTCGEDYIIISDKDIDENGSLKTNTTISNKIKNPLYNSLTIDCEYIYLYQTSMDLKIEIPNEKIDRFDYLIINGIKFNKDKGECGK